MRYKSSEWPYDLSDISSVLCDDSSDESNTCPYEMRIQMKDGKIHFYGFSNKDDRQNIANSLMNARSKAKPLTIGAAEIMLHRIVCEKIEALQYDVQQLRQAIREKE